MTRGIARGFRIKCGMTRRFTHGFRIKCGMTVVGIARGFRIKCGMTRRFTRGFRVDARNDGGGDYPWIPGAEPGMTGGIARGCRLRSRTGNRSPE